jgi:Cytidylate kinase-like family
MALWTISAQAGTGAPEVARELARRAEVELLDREALLPLAHELEPEITDADELEERISSRFTALALGAAIATGAPDAVREFKLRKTLPDLGRAIVREAARRTAVIFRPPPSRPSALIPRRSTSGCALRSSGASRRISERRSSTVTRRRRRSGTTMSTSARGYGLSTTSTSTTRRTSRSSST